MHGGVRGRGSNPPTYSIVTVLAPKPLLFDRTGNQCRMCCFVLYYFDESFAMKIQLLNATLQTK